MLCVRSSPTSPSREGAGELRHVIRECSTNRHKWSYNPCIPLGLSNGTSAFSWRAKEPLWPKVELASLWVPNLEGGRDCFFKQSQLPTRSPGQCQRPSWETCIFTSPCSRQPHAVFEPIRSNIGSWGHGKPAGGGAEEKGCLLHPSDRHADGHL